MTDIEDDEDEQIALEMSMEAITKSAGDTAFHEFILETYRKTKDRTKEDHPLYPYRVAIVMLAKSLPKMGKTTAVIDTIKAGIQKDAFLSKVGIGEIDKYLQPRVFGRWLKKMTDEVEAEIKIRSSKKETGNE